MWWAVLPYLVVEEWIVGAAEYDGVDVGVHPEEGVDAFTDEVVGTWLVVFSVFYEGYPHGACESGDGAVGREFMDFEVVGLGAYGTSVARTPMWRVRVCCPTISAVGRMTPSTRRSG